ncbi:MAG: endonuclease III [Chloroflexi bacterium]|nr:endonuclease III [Chloroflexota bacterium]
MQTDEAERVATIVDRLHRAYPNATCSLNYSTALELLVATILSAQCTDDRVNIVTGTLFQKYRTAEDYASAPPAELEEDIKSTGFYRNKARHIQAACRLLAERHGGEIPRQMDLLLELPGVARKTANVVLGNAYGIVDGVVVDTHVGRIARRLGLTQSADPVRVETDLMAALPPSEWLVFAHEVILHGRAICQAKRPLCAECVLSDVCPSSTVSPATAAAAPGA